MAKQDEEKPKQEKQKRFEVVEAVTQTMSIIRDNETGEQLSTGEFQADLLKHICDIKNVLEDVRKQFA